MEILALLTYVVRVVEFFLILLVCVTLLRREQTLVRRRLSPALMQGFIWVFYGVGISMGWYVLAGLLGYLGWSTVEGRMLDLEFVVWIPMVLLTWRLLRLVRQDDA